MLFIAAVLAMTVFSFLFKKTAAEIINLMLGWLVAMESRDFGSVLRLVSRHIFASLGLDGYMSPS